MSPRLVADHLGRLPPSPTEAQVLKIIEHHTRGEEFWMSPQTIWRHCKEHGLDRAEGTIQKHLQGLERKKWLYYRFEDKKRRRKPQYALIDPRFYNNCGDCGEEFRSMELDYLCEQCRNR